MTWLWVAVMLAAPAQEESAGFDHSEWTGLLQRAVSERGVDYDWLAGNKPALNHYVDRLAEADPGSWSREEQMAFWINAYNAVMIQSVVEHWPLESVLDISKILKLIPTGWVFYKKHRVGGADRSLDDIEHRILRGRFKDPRIHAAINCASVSCPPLVPRAFEGPDLDSQLDAAMQAFLLDPQRNQLRASPPRLSKIFSWFREDFEDQGTLWEYVRSAVPDSVAGTLRVQAQPEFLPYNWEINSAK